VPTFVKREVSRGQRAIVVIVHSWTKGHRVCLFVWVTFPSFLISALYGVFSFTLMPLYPRGKGLSVHSGYCPVQQTQMGTMGVGALSWPVRTVTVYDVIFCTM
jgi:hypothetical protein